MLSKISELRERQIINITDGKCLGMVKDIEIDIEEGCICGLILATNRSLWRLLPAHEEIIIPWKHVVRIGIEVVLIESQQLGLAKEKKNKRTDKKEQFNPWQRELVGDDELDLTNLPLAVKL